METINYKNLEWYVINETDKEKLLFLKDCFTNEQIQKYFKDTSMIDSNFNVKFSNNLFVWWKDSYIREELNTNFLKGLDINDLNVMRTKIVFNGQKVISEDYVRLITLKEIEKINKNCIDVLKTKSEYRYWTMTPFYWKNIMLNLNDSDENVKTREFYVNGTSDNIVVSTESVNNFLSIRPIISLKKNNLDSGLIIPDEEEMIKELKRAVSL